MKRITCVLLCTLVLAMSCAAAETLTTLADVQKVLHNTHPHDLLYGPDITVSLTGTIVEVTPANGWDVYRIECASDGLSASMLGYDKPCFVTWGFDMHVGDHVRVNGKLNNLYSSPLVPFIGQADITVLQ